jgi:hypothetical protein
MMSDRILLDELIALTGTANEDNLGDVFLDAISLSSRISDPFVHQIAEYPLSRLRSLAANAGFGWKLFASPPSLQRKLQNIEVLQLFAIERALHELCYACEMVEASSAKTWGGSTPTRFYLNSIYHYVSSLFLIDTSSPKQKGLPMGGTVVRALHPMGLARFLAPVQIVLNKPFGKDTSFGGAILRLRHSYLVHGNFSPRNIEYLVAQTEIREPAQKQKFVLLVWELFHEVIMLRLNLIGLLTDSDIQIEKVMLTYLESALSSRKQEDMVHRGSSSQGAQPQR